MQYEMFLSTVRDSAELPDQAAADRAVRSTLRVLGHRLAGGRPGNLAAQLPGDLGAALGSEGAGERFDLADFYRRFADDAGVPQPQARRNARATMAAISVAVTDEEYGKLAAQLPAEYADLLLTDAVRHR